MEPAKRNYSRGCATSCNTRPPTPGASTVGPPNATLLTNDPSTPTQAALGPQVACRQPSPSTFAVRNENELRLIEAIEKLSPDYRQVIELRNFERLPFGEVGLKMGRSEDAAGKLWFRAIQKLREELAVSNDSEYSFS